MVVTARRGVVLLWLRFSMLMSPARAGCCAGSANALAFARLFPLSRTSAWESAARHTLVPWDDIDEEVEQIGSTNCASNIGPLNGPPFMLFRDQERSTSQVRNEDLAGPCEENRCFSRNHLDLVVRLHHFLDSGQGELALSRQPRLKVDNIPICIASLLHKIHLVSPE